MTIVQPGKHNRKLIGVTSSIECREQKYVDLKDFKRYLDQICYRAQAPDCHHAMPERAKFALSLTDKIQDGGGRHIEFRKMAIFPQWIMTFAPNLAGRCTTATRRRDDHVNNKKLSCRRETARCFVSLNTSLSHSRSFEMTYLSRAYVSPY